MKNSEKFKEVFGFGADGSRVIAVNATWWDCEFQNRKPITNYDRFRSMSDEELATLFEEYGDCPPRSCPHDGKGTKITRIDCRECWLDWLRQEVDNG